MYIKKMNLIGLALKNKTTNENGKSSVDCGTLWQKFENENYPARINGKLSDEIFAVYHNYDGGRTKPFSYFIGCSVTDGTPVPEGMDYMTTREGEYQKIEAKGKIPFCITEAWEKIWNSDLPRTYQTDFEIYDERSKNWDNGEVDIFLSV